METLEQISQTLALSMGAAWASGVNLYATLLMLGILAQTGNIQLPPDLLVLADPLVIAAAGTMYLIEFVADKTPGVDSGWDTIHTFIRIPAGAVLAAGAVGELAPAPELAAAIVGGTIAAGTHATKMSTRLLINTSPEPVSNWTASLGEDLAVVAGLWTALHYPWLFLGLLLAFIILMIWLLPRLWTTLKRVFAWIGRRFAGSPQRDTG
ncbi:MAG TPA: DUF4126 domain-containing protein [Methylothermaceae bacterium]|nr:DUF4126 domain-containing protein [Methylothermaceae bacterium]